VKLVELWMQLVEWTFQVIDPELSLGRRRSVQAKVSMKSHLVEST
jgi:hypothetical protein